MKQIFTLDQIQPLADSMDFSLLIEEGFKAYSQGQVVVPPVGELQFENPPGDVHIKYGYIQNDDIYVIKVASGFYENAQYNLPSSQGLMLVFCQKTGQLLAVLLDDGYLTDVRTAVAGQICAKYLAPKAVNAIGIFGTGIQGKMQLSSLRSVTSCRKVIVWGRSSSSLEQYAKEMTQLGFTIETTQDPAYVASHCNLMVMTTPSQTPLLTAEMIRPGTHITAVGSDIPAKQELDSQILAMADQVVVDSLSQCLERGEVHHGLKNKDINKNQLIELGEVIAKGVNYRTQPSQITIADLTGVAVQDIQIAKAVYQQLRTC